MKKMIMGLALLSLPSVFAADTSLSPSYLKLKVHKVAVSTSALCTNLQTVFNETSPTEVDFLISPTIGSGGLADGTYPCIAIEFDDVIKYAPSTSSTSGHCTSGTAASLDVCRSGSSGKLIDGTSVTCTSGTEKVTMYLSTASTDTAGSANVFTPPTSSSDSAHGLKLSAALTISGTSSAKFVVNGTGKVCDTADASCNGADSTSCQMDPPAFSFVKI